MIELKKETLQEFLERYEDLHDSLITNIEYDIHESKLQLMIINASRLTELGEVIVDKYKDVKIRIIFDGVEQLNIKEFFSWDYIHAAYLRSLKIKNKEFLCFANDEEEPFIYIVCETIKYEEI